MNSDAYSLSDAYISVGGSENYLPAAADKMLREWVGNHYVVAAALILVLTLVVVWLIVMRSEHFMPTSTMRFQKMDGLGMSENMDAAPGRAQSAFTQQVQSGGVATSSTAAQVLASADFDCANRKAVTDDAWAWMSGVANENMVGKPTNDNDFSRILSGH